MDSALKCSALVSLKALVIKDRSNLPSCSVIGPRSVMQPGSLHSPTCEAKCAKSEGQGPVAEQRAPLGARDLA